MVDAVHSMDDMGPGLGAPQPWTGFRALGDITPLMENHSRWDKHPGHCGVCIYIADTVCQHVPDLGNDESKKRWRRTVCGSITHPEMAATRRLL